MKTAAIIAEFNPFHNGHQHLVKKVKEKGYERCVAVMSGNWVQRGDTGIISKFARAKQALLCGFDLVVELPTFWAMATAQKFAKGAVDIIANLNVDAIAFGSECGDITRLMQTVYALRSEEFSIKLRELLDSGLPLAQARETAIECICKNGDLLRNPNDTLAIEYIMAAKDLALNLDFIPIKRIGVGHDSEITADGFCSASKLRSLILKGDLLSVARCMPKASFKILKEEYDNGRISDFSKFETTVLAVLRATNKDDYKALPDISEGIENRLYNAARMCSNYNELLDFTATKRYTNARLRRLIISAFLRMRAEDIPETVPYIRVLGHNDNGADILQKARGSSTLPIEMRSTSLKDSTCFKFEERSTDIYSLTFQKPVKCGEEFTNGVINIAKEEN